MGCAALVGSFCPNKLTGISVRMIANALNDAGIRLIVILERNKIQRLDRHSTNALSLVHLWFPQRILVFVIDGVGIKKQMHTGR
jgi:hypothetical protein